MEKLKEKEVLFVVRKLQNYIHLARHAFEVINLTNNEGIVNTYKLFGRNYTPAKVNDCSIVQFHNHCFI